MSVSRRNDEMPEPLPPERNRTRQAHDARRQAIAELTSVLAGEGPAIPTGPPLFVAAALVMRAAGIEARRPAPWQERPSAADPVATIAAASQIRYRQVVLHDGWQREDCGPLLGFCGAERRPVALVPSARGGYEVIDPAAGARGPATAVLAELDAQAYMFYRPLPAHAERWGALLRFALHGRGRDLRAIFLTGAAATLLGMLVPVATGVLIDRAIPDGQIGLLTQLGLGLAAAALGAALFRWSQGIAAMRLETAADVATQSAVWDRLLGLKLAFFRKFTTGDLDSRVDAIAQIRAALGGVTLRSLFSSVTLLLNLILLLLYSPLLTGLAIVVAALGALTTLISGRMVLARVRRTLELRGNLFGLVVQLLQGASKLRVAAAEERAFGRWARMFAELVRLELRCGAIQDGVYVINVALQSASTIVLFALAGTLVGRGLDTLTVGSFLAFNVAYGVFVGAVATLSNTVIDLMSIGILRERARPILEGVPEVIEGRADPGPLAGRVELDQVTFRYRGDGPAILDQVSLRAAPGEFVALVGPSGSGKSTLVRLLLGFESPQAGAIYYDGQDLAGLDILAVRRQMGVVLQGGRISAGSLFDSVACGSRLSLNEAWEAARATGFAEDIEAMPMGMHTVISEGGTNLSGGQRQRLLLTRALVHHPRILLLDEATSALDNRTQAIVAESLARLRVTRVIVAHRLSTIRNADRIYVVEAGRMVQEGTFDELASTAGLFAKLIARQRA
jgi:NHLM bacteriocin system ABC transporter ATP-binding protein